MSDPTRPDLAAIAARHAAILRTREALGPRATLADVYRLDPELLARLLLEDVPALLAAACGPSGSLEPDQARLLEGLAGQFYGGDHEGGVLWPLLDDTARERYRREAAERMAAEPTAGR